MKFSKIILFSMVFALGAGSYLSAESLLMRAIRESNITKIRRVIPYSIPDVNKVDNDGNTPLLLLIKSKDIAIKNKLEFIKTLLKNGADTSLKNKDGKKAFDITQQLKDGNIKTELLELLKPKPKACPRRRENRWKPKTTNDEEKPNGRMRKLKKLDVENWRKEKQLGASITKWKPLSIAQKLDRNNGGGSCVEKQRRTAFSKAQQILKFIKKGNMKEEDLIKKINSFGEAIDVLNRFAKSALYYALIYRLDEKFSFDLFKCLLENGADPDIKINERNENGAILSLTILQKVLLCRSSDCFFIEYKNFLRYLFYYLVNPYEIKKFAEEFGFNNDFLNMLNAYEIRYQEYINQRYNITLKTEETEENHARDSFRQEIDKLFLNSGDWGCCGPSKKSTNEFVLPENKKKIGSVGDFPFSYRN